LRNLAYITQKLVDVGHVGLLHQFDQIGCAFKLSLLRVTYFISKKVVVKVCRYSAPTAVNDFLEFIWGLIVRSSLYWSATKEYRMNISYNVRNLGTLMHRGTYIIEKLTTLHAMRE